MLVTNGTAIRKFIDDLARPYAVLWRDDVSVQALDSVRERHGGYLVAFLDRSDSDFWRHDAEKNTAFVAQLEDAVPLADVRVSDTDRLRIWRVGQPREALAPMSLGLGELSRSSPCRRRRRSSSWCSRCSRSRSDGGESRASRWPRPPSNCGSPRCPRSRSGSRRASERPPGAPISELAPADAILLLGGATKPALPPREFPELVEAADRITHAARLFRAGKAPLIVVSSGRLPWQRDVPPEAEGIGQLLETLGVPASAIVREETSANTYENCVNSKQLLDARGARDVLLVTSALHMRRAYATCRSAGLAVRPAPTDFWVAGDEAQNLDIVPDPEALMLTHLVLRERLGYFVYERRGWIRPGL